MGRKNPRPGQGAGADLSIAADTSSPNRNRRILQASPLARMQLQALLWAGWLTFGGVRP